MLRARRTADQVLKLHPSLARVRIDSDLQEVRTGWQGEPLASLEELNWDLYANPRGKDDESLYAIQSRMQRWLRRVLMRHPGEEVVGVSHGDPILILVGTLSGLPLDPLQIFPRPYIGTGVLYRLMIDPNGACQQVEMFVPHAEAAA